jgi:hypothetical protein
MRSLFVLTALLLVSGLAPLAVAAPKAPAPDIAPIDYPWPLRVHYSFDSNDMQLDYDEHHSRIRVRMGEQLIIADDLTFAITFADGNTWNYRSLEEAKTSRDSHTDPLLGPAILFTTRYPVKDGLEVRYVLTAFSTRPFVTLQLQVENKGAADVRIGSLDPLITGAGGVGNLSPQARVRDRHIGTRGGYPVFDKAADPTVTIFTDPTTKAVLAIGVLPEGRADSGMHFDGEGGVWNGRVHSTFTPAVKLAPGQTLSSDRVCLAHGKLEQDDIDLYYSWAVSKLDPPKDNRKGPAMWVTVSDAEGADGLAAIAKDWAASGVKHALVPRSVPFGSLKGAAGAVKNAGVTAGATLDPLAVDDGPKDAVAQASDGTKWLNPAAPSAADFLGKRLSKLEDWGYGFVVVAPTTMPDAVLESFNITRIESYELALKLVEQATGEMPVYPASSGSLKPTRADWLEAASALGRMSEYTIGFAPQRLDAGSIGDLDLETLGAMRLWKGPIEVVGRPQGGGTKALARLMQMPRLDAAPIDMARTDPLLWQINHRDDAGKVVGASVLAFSGAEPFAASDVDLPDGAKMRLWDPQRNAFAGDAETVTPSASLQLYGVGAEAAHPVFMGASDTSALSVPNVKAVAWDAGANTLKGSFDGTVTADTVVKVHVPAGWKVASSEVGGKKSKGELTGESFALSLGGSSSFSVKFDRN